MLTTKQTTAMSPISDARKYHESLHSLSEGHWYELTHADCPDRMEPGLN